MKRIIALIIALASLCTCLTSCKKECEHELETHPGKFRTCTEIGWDNYETCKKCDYTTYKEKAPLGHTYEDGKCVLCGDEEGYDTPIIDIN